MSKLLKGNLVRLCKSKIFWLCTVAVFFVVIFIMQMGRKALQVRNVTMDEYFFYVGPMISLFFSVFISMFIGTEHSDGTIRNKLIIGHSRKQIYLAYYLTCLIGVGIMIAAWFLGGLTGIPILGAFTISTAEIITNILITILYCALLTAIFVFFGVMLQSKAASAVAQIIFAIILILCGSMIFNQLCEPKEVAGAVLVDGKIVMSDPEPNPMYISGVMRQIYIALVNLLPTGQGILMLHWDDGVPIIIPLQIISSILLAFGITVVGIMAFRRKDLK